MIKWVEGTNEYIDTDVVIFHDVGNNGTISGTFDKNIYPYYKKDGKYYKNEGSGIVDVQSLIQPYENTLFKKSNGTYEAILSKGMIYPLAEDLTFDEGKLYTDTDKYKNIFQHQYDENQQKYDEKSRINSIKSQLINNIRIKKGNDALPLHVLRWEGESEKDSAWKYKEGNSEKAYQKDFALSYQPTLFWDGFTENNKMNCNVTYENQINDNDDLKRTVVFAFEAKTKRNVANYYNYYEGSCWADFLEEAEISHNIEHKTDIYISAEPELKSQEKLVWDMHVERQDTSTVASNIIKYLSYKYDYVDKQIKTDNLDIEKAKIIFKNNELTISTKTTQKLTPSGDYSVGMLGPLWCTYNFKQNYDLSWTFTNNFQSTNTDINISPEIVKTQNSNNFILETGERYYNGQSAAYSIIANNTQDFMVEYNTHPNLTIETKVDFNLEGFTVKDFEGVKAGSNEIYEQGVSIPYHFYNHAYDGSITKWYWNKKGQGFQDRPSGEVMVPLNIENMKTNFILNEEITNPKVIIIWNKKYRSGCGDDIANTDDASHIYSYTNPNEKRRIIQSDSEGWHRGGAAE